MENDRAVLGDNNPPSDIEETLAPYQDAIEEAANWLDGQAVETEDQMNAVDVLIKQVRKCKTDIEKAEKTTTSPLHDAWKTEIARWKPAKEDIERRLKGLASLVNDFKRKLAEEKEAARRVAYEAQRQAEAAALEAERKANAGNLQDQEAADRLKQGAMDAKKAASVANRDTVKGLRTVTRYEITDHRALLHWIASNDKAAMTAFIEEYARQNHKAGKMDGLRVWTKKAAY